MALGPLSGQVKSRSVKMLLVVWACLIPGCCGMWRTNGIPLESYTNHISTQQVELLVDNSVHNDALDGASDLHKGAYNDFPPENKHYKHERQQEQMQSHEQSNVSNRRPSENVGWSHRPRLLQVEKKADNTTAGRTAGEAQQSATDTKGLEAKFHGWSENNTQAELASTRIAEGVSVNAFHPNTKVPFHPHMRHNFARADKRLHFSHVPYDVNENDVVTSAYFETDNSSSSFFMNVLGMFLLKLLCGLDDMALLTSLVSTKSNVQNNVNTIVYLMTFMVLGVGAWSISVVVDSIVPDKGGGDEGFWSVDKISSLVCGSILVLFGIRDWYFSYHLHADEEMKEDFEDVNSKENYTICQENSASIQEDTQTQSGEEAVSEQKSMANKQKKKENKLSMNEGSPSFAVKEEESKRYPSEHAKDGIISLRQDHQALRPQQESTTDRDGDEPASSNETPCHESSLSWHYVPVILLLAVDDAIVFTCVIQGASIGLWDVLLGMFLGVMTIIIVCRLLAHFAIIRQILQRVPKWLLIVGLGTWIILGGFFPLEGKDSPIGENSFLF